MKYLISILTLLSLAMPSAFGILTQTMAVNAVMRRLSEERKASSEFYVGEKDANTWLVFEDMHPNAMWGHAAVEYYLPKSASTLSPQITQASVTKFPSCDLTRVLPNGNIPMIASEDRYVEVNVPVRDVPQATNQYVVMLSGGMDQYNNFPRYWNNCSWLYRVMTKHFNVPKENIFLAFSNGMNKLEPDFRGTHSSSDFDGDGLSDIKYDASKTGLDRLFRDLSARLTPTDHLLFYVTDHGGADEYNGKGTSIWLWNNRQLYASELRDMLKNLNCASINVVMDLCYDGGFVPYLKEIKNVSVSTSCAANQLASVNLKVTHTLFTEAWLNAIWKTPLEADLDGNGVVSIDEAFKYAQPYPNANGAKTQQDPQFYTSHTNLARSMSFDYRPKPYNLCIRDSYTDNGCYSSNRTRMDSPDIIVRDRIDTDTVFSNPRWISADRGINYVNVRITNKGWQTYTPSASDPVCVEAYWSAGGPVSSKADYTGKNKDAEGYVVGGKVGSVALDQSVSPGQTVTVRIPWRAAECPGAYMGRPLNIMVTVGASDALATSDNSNYTAANYPYVSERHYYTLPYGTTNETLRLNLPQDLPQGVDFKFFGGAEGHKFYLKSNSLFGDDELHFFDSDNLISNIRPTKNTEYALTFGYTLQPMTFHDTMSMLVQVINRRDGSVLGAYGMTRYRINSIGQITLNIEEKPSGLESVELTANVAEDAGDVQFTWLNNASEIVGSGDAYRGPRKDIDGGTLVCQTAEGFAEMPVELQTVASSIVIAERTSETLLLRRQGALDTPLVIEIASAGENVTVESINWPSNTEEISVKLPAASGIIVLTAVCGDERQEIERLMRN